MDASGDLYDHTTAVPKTKKCSSKNKKTQDLNSKQPNCSK